MTGHNLTGVVVHFATNLSGLASFQQCYVNVPQVTF